MGFNFWLGVVILLVGTFSLPALAAFVMWVYVSRLDRDWTKSNRLFFPWKHAVGATCAATIMLGYLMFGVKPVVGWLAPRLIGISNHIEPIFVTRGVWLDAKTDFWASAMSSDREHMSDAASVDVAVWVTRNEPGPCPLYRDDYRVTISGGGFSVPSSVNQDAQSGRCGIGWEWSVAPKQIGTYVIEVGLQQRRKGLWRSVSFPLVVKIAHKETAVERFGWVQTFGMMLASTILGAVVTPLAQRAIERRTKKPNKPSGILMP